MVRRCHVSFVTWGVQLILAYSWARPAILVAGKGREVMFLFLLFLHFHSCFSFFPVPPFHLFCYLFCLFSPFLWETTQNDPQGLSVVKPQLNQSIKTGFSRKDFAPRGNRPTEKKVKYFHFLVLIIAVLDINLWIS